MDLSVIIPVYNTEKYLKKCVDSIIHQEGVDLEIILVDDGSHDSSGAICDQYAKEHSNITSIHIKNSGPATAKNQGLSLAKGDFIALIDSDDELVPTMFQEMCTAGNKFNAEIVCCSYKQIDEAGNISHTDSTNKTYVLNHEEALLHLLSKKKIYSQCWTKIFKRSLITDNGIKNDDGLRTDEDFIFNIKAFCKSNTTVIVDKPLYIYTHRENSLAHSYFRKNINKYIDNRILRAETTDTIVANESQKIQDWAYIYNVRYYNELVGRVAILPELHKDSRLKNIFSYMKKNKHLVNDNSKFCGFSKIGVLLFMALPSSLYLKYRQAKAQESILS